jgi:hypothetical protein
MTIAQEKTYFCSNGTSVTTVSSPLCKTGQTFVILCNSLLSCMTLVKATMSQDCNVLNLLHILADYLAHLYQTNPKNFHFHYLFLDFLGPSVHKQSPQCEIKNEIATKKI